MSRNYMIYKNPNEAIEARVKDLLSRMTLIEKLAQMTQIEKTVATSYALTELSIGSILSGGGSGPFQRAAPSDWADMIDAFQKSALKSRLGIPIIYGTDAVHGHNNVYGATIFPHNVGLGATRDVDLVQRIGTATALEVRATGVHYTFAPCVAVCRDPRWGRCYESFSEDTEIVRKMTSVISGLQGLPPPGHPNGYPYVAGSVELVLLPVRSILLVMGVLTEGLMKGMLYYHLMISTKIHMAPYVDCLSQGISTVMASYSSWNGSKLHSDYFLLTQILKDKLGFKGIVISDWEGLDRLCRPHGSDYRYCISSSIKAGVDMSHRELAREAVSEILGLVKKNGKDSKKPLLPLHRNASRILLLEDMQMILGTSRGGWTITWHESLGDDSELKIPFNDTELVKSVAEKVPTLVILISGRPLVLAPRVTWFKRVDQLPMNAGDQSYDPLFPLGFGLRFNSGASKPSSCDYPGWQNIRRYPRKKKKVKNVMDLDKLVLPSSSSLALALVHPLVVFSIFLTIMYHIRSVVAYQNVKFDVYGNLNEKKSAGQLEKPLIK
ncbi:hypothetical protein IFM89_027470 [Coptis chinensis]|uniref:Glycoside hydrolase family 3 N-terminal domain-containing protein n=1 Tax=Coptis chinensis TaxID=261450 RepID=A0A835HFG3_9MAGN|nr:hypothetical protein IFM89_027470 [Coptis chinensis]